METALENLSKEDLLNVVFGQRKEITDLSKSSCVKDEKIQHLIQERDHLKSQFEMLNRMQFGQKRERFEGDPAQTMLRFHTEPVEVEQQQEVKQKIEYICKRSNHKGRAKLTSTPYCGRD